MKNVLKNLRYRVVGGLLALACTTGVYAGIFGIEFLENKKTGQQVILVPTIHEGQASRFWQESCSDIVASTNKQFFSCVVGLASLVGDQAPVFLTEAYSDCSDSTNPDTYKADSTVQFLVQRKVNKQSPVVKFADERTSAINALKSVLADFEKYASDTNVLNIVLSVLQDMDRGCMYWKGAHWSRDIAPVLDEAYNKFLLAKQKFASVLSGDIKDPEVLRGIEKLWTECGDTGYKNFGLMDHVLKELKQKKMRVCVVAGKTHTEFIGELLKKMDFYRIEERSESWQDYFVSLVNIDLDASAFKSSRLLYTIFLQNDTPEKRREALLKLYGKNLSQACQGIEKAFALWGVRSESVIAKPKPTENVLGICGFCKKTGAKAQCAGCEKVCYCNRACQVKDWVTHKLVCKKK